MIKKIGNKYRIDFRDQTGRRYRKFYDTRKEADRAHSEAKSQIHQGRFLPPHKIPMFSEAAESWYKNRLDRRPSTLANYRSHLDTHLIPLLKDLRLDEISVEMVERLRMQLREDRKLAPKTIGSLIGTLSQIFKQAIRHRFVNENPVQFAERPYTPSDELTDDVRESYKSEAVMPDDILNADEIKTLLDHSNPGIHRTLFALIAGSGLRSGEAFALRWPDIEFKLDHKGRGRISVRKSLSWSKRDTDGTVARPRFYPPKTRAGRRDVKIHGALVHALKVWKLECPPSDLDLVFCTSTGRPVMRGNILRWGFRPALRRAGLRHVTMHSLRHSYASLLIQEGATITEVQKALGHANPGITLRVYSHFLKDAETPATDRVGDALFGVQKVSTSVQFQPTSDDLALPQAR